MPAAVLADGLKLNSTQTSKIQAIQDQYGKDRTSLFSSASQGGDRQEMMQKMQSLTEETTKSIEGVLTESQNKAAPGFIKAIGGYPMVGIPLGATFQSLSYPAARGLRSPRSQKALRSRWRTRSQLDRQQTRTAEARAPGGGGGGFQAMQEMMKPNIDKAAAVLTAGQKATLAKYIADHPQRDFGGRGGGGRRGGGAAGGNGPV